MLNSNTPTEDGEAERVEQIVVAGPTGALALAGVATAIVISIWFAFYLFVFLPRGALQ